MPNYDEDRKDWIEKVQERRNGGWVVNDKYNVPNNTSNRDCQAVKEWIEEDGKIEPASEDVKPTLGDRIGNLEKASGTGEQAGERGIAQRLDKLEDRIAELEKKS